MSAFMNFLIKNNKISFVLFFVFSLVFSVFIWHAAEEYYQSNNQEKFENFANESQHSIEKHLSRCGDILVSGTSFIHATDQVTLQKWHTFVQHLEIEKNYPGMQGYGFTVMINPSELEAKEKQIRAEGHTSFAVKPAGKRELYSAIIYLEPMNKRNLNAIGYDMYSEAVRREAMNLARDTGSMALTGKVTLVQEIDAHKQAGILIYMPVYQKGASPITLEERQEKLIGFVYSPYRMNDLMESIHLRREYLDFEIYDGDTIEDKSRLYGSLSPSYVPRYSTLKTIKLYNRIWTIRFVSTEAFDRDNDTFYPLLMTGGSIPLFFVLLQIIFSLVKSRYLLKQQTVVLQTLQTEILERSKAFEESEYRWKFALEGSGDGLWDWNVQTSEVYFSLRLKEMLGFGEDEISGSLSEWEKRVHPDDLPYVNEDLQKHFSGETTAYINEHRLLCKDGSYKWILDRGVVVERAPDGKPIRMIGTHKDIDPQKKLLDELIEAKEAAEASARSKSEFLATMSHEIRTPMNGVLGMLSLLERSSLDITQRHQLSIAIDSATSLLGLINDILDFSKIEAGKMDVELLEFDLKKELENFVESIGFKAQEKGISLDLNLSDIHYPFIVFDPSRLRQILINLVGNAVKFTAHGGVHIKASLKPTNTHEGELKIDICDTGIGISKEKIAVLFNSFTQADSSTTRQYGGTGLGLSIVKRLCELMGGRIHVQSVLGEGSCFSLEFRVKLGSVAHETKKNESIASESVDNMVEWPSKTRLLLVEDNATNQMVAQGMLNFLGLHADIAFNGLEALEAIKIANSIQPYSLVLMDCQMPEMDGYETTRAIRMGEAGNDNRNIPIIAMTANAMQGDREKCVAVGMNDYIAKPIDLEVLRTTLKKWLVGKEDERSPIEAAVKEKEPVLWDEADIFKRLGGNTMLVTKVIRQFLDDIGTIFQALRQAMDEQNAPSVQLHAHSLKGSSGNVGALKLQLIARSFEEAAKNNDLSLIRETLSECEIILDQTTQVLRDYLAQQNKGSVTRKKRLDSLKIAMILQEIKQALDQGKRIEDYDALGIFYDYTDEDFTEQLMRLKKVLEENQHEEAKALIDTMMMSLN